MYSLIIIDGIPWVFEDMALMIKHATEAQGEPSEIVRFFKPEEYDESKIHGDKRIYFGQQLPFCKNGQIKPGSIIGDFDPIGADILSKLPDDVINANKFISYSQKLINHIKKKHPSINIKKFEYGYSKYLDLYTKYPNEFYDVKLTPIPVDRKIVDVCFLIGQIKHPRRLIMIDSILKEGIDIYYNNILICDRDRLVIYNKSKIVLNVYSLEENLEFSSGSRIFPAVSMGCFVISEKCHDPEEHKKLEKVCVNVEFDQILPTIKYYLEHEEERVALAKKFHDNIKEMISTGYEFDAI